MPYEGPPGYFVDLPANDYVAAWIGEQQQYTAEQREETVHLIERGARGGEQQVELEPGPSGDTAHIQIGEDLVQKYANLNNRQYITQQTRNEAVQIREVTQREVNNDFVIRAESVSSCSSESDIPEMRRQGATAAALQPHLPKDKIIKRYPGDAPAASTAITGAFAPDGTKAKFHMPYMPGSWYEDPPEIPERPAWEVAAEQNPQYAMKDTPRVPKVVPKRLNNVQQARQYFHDRMPLFVGLTLIAIGCLAWLLARSHKIPLARWASVVLIVAGGGALLIDCINVRATSKK